MEDRLDLNIGHVTAYAYAKSKGYTGTEEQFAIELAQFAQNAQKVAEDRAAVEALVDEFMNTTVPSAVQSVTNEGTRQIELVGDAGTTQIGLVQDEGTTQIGNVNDAGTVQVGNVNQAGTTQVGNVTNEGTTQVNRVQAKGDEVIDSIPSDYSDLSNEVDDLTRQLSDVENEIASLDDALVEYDEQFLDNTQYEQLYYWYNSSGNVTKNYNASGTAYYAYPKITLSAGTYYINYVPNNFAFLKTVSSGTVVTLKSVTTNNSFTISEDTEFYLTVYDSTGTTYPTVMLANATLPQAYIYGKYNYRFKYVTIDTMAIANGENKILTVGDGADYTTIQAACDAANVGDIIFVLPGIYTEQISIFGKKLHIIGFDKKLCTIIDHSADYDTPPVEMNIGTLANFTIIEDGTNPTPDLPVGKDHLSYCIHNDNSTNTNGETLEIVNCDMRNDVHSCIGFGMYANYTVIIRNCTMRSNAVKDATYKRGALYYHANSGSDIIGQKFIVENCVISCADTIVMYAGVPGTGSGELVSRFNNNALWSDINGATNSAVSISANSAFVMDDNCYGNNIQKLNSMMPVIGSTNTVTVNASSSAAVNNQKNRIKSGHIYEFLAISEDGTSYSTGFLNYISTETAIVTIEVKNVSCNVSASYSNGEIRVWNRDASNQHSYTLFVKMIA